MTTNAGGAHRKCLLDRKEEARGRREQKEEERFMKAKSGSSDKGSFIYKNPSNRLDSINKKLIH